MSRDQDSTKAAIAAPKSTEQGFFRRWLLPLLVLFLTSGLLLVVTIVLIVTYLGKNETQTYNMVVCGYLVVQLCLCTFGLGLYAKKFFSLGLAVKAAGSGLGFLASALVGFTLAVTCLASLALTGIAGFAAVEAVTDPEGFEERARDRDVDLEDWFD